MLKKKRKFDYSGKKYSNPFFHKKNKFRANKISKIIIGSSFEWGWHFKFFIFLIIVIFFVSAWFFYFSSYFNISSVEITGSEKISREDVEGLVWRQVGKRRFLIGQQHNLNLFSEEEFLKELNEHYYFKSIIIHKKWPDKILINLEEKDYSFVWHEADNYYYIDSNGNIISEAELLEIKQFDYPLIDNMGESKILNRVIKVDTNEISFIFKLFQELKNNYGDFKAERFILDSDINTVKLDLLDGPLVYFSTESDIIGQIIKLQVIVRDKLKDSFKDKTYIDLRYGDRVYYR